MGTYWLTLFLLTLYDLVVCRIKVVHGVLAFYLWTGSGPSVVLKEQCTELVWGRLIRMVCV